MKKLWIILLVLLISLSTSFANIENIEVGKIENPYFSLKIFQDYWFVFEKEALDDFTYNYVLSYWGDSTIVTVYNSIVNKILTEEEEKRIYNIMQDFSVHDDSFVTKNGVLKNWETLYYFSWIKWEDSFPMELILSKWNIHYKIEGDLRKDWKGLRKAIEMYKKINILKKDITLGNMAFKDLSFWGLKNWHLSYDNSKDNQSVVACHLEKNRCFIGFTDQEFSMFISMLASQWDLKNTKFSDEVVLLEWEVFKNQGIEDIFIVKWMFSEDFVDTRSFKYTYNVVYWTYNFIFASKDKIDEQIQEILTQITVDNEN